MVSKKFKIYELIVNLVHMAAIYYLIATFEIIKVEATFCT